MVEILSSTIRGGHVMQINTSSLLVNLNGRPPAIEMVHDAVANTNHAQLIFTTYDTGLLDLILLWRDQIWFAEKDKKAMQTDVYALTEFSSRKGENISQGYLQGCYGAIPFIGGMDAWEE